jgi:hypothetical protein
MQYTITLQPQDLDILSAALGKLPYEVVAPLINKLSTQIAEQQIKE